MYPAKTSFLPLKKTFVLTLIGAVAIGFPARAHSLIAEANRCTLRSNLIVFSTPDLSGNGRPDDRQGDGASRLSRCN